MAADVRGIANYVLDRASSSGRALSNMQINKVVYFLHADYLASHGEPLVSAKIEAWEHGPVFRELYSEFKRYQDGHITGRAVSTSPVTGERSTVNYNLSDEQLRFLDPLADRYTAMSASTLRTLSHMPGGPWDRVWNHEGAVKATMRITDAAILEWFRGALH